MLRLNKKLDYPHNLLKELLCNESDTAEVTDDMVNGLHYVVAGLPQEEKLLILLRYEDRYTYKQLIEAFQTSEIILKRAMIKVTEKLKQPAYSRLIKYGMQHVTMPK